MKYAYGIVAVVMVAQGFIWSAHLLREDEVGRRREREVRSSSKTNVLEGVCAVKSSGNTDGIIKVHGCLLR